MFLLESPDLVPIIVLITTVIYAAEAQNECKFEQDGYYIEWYYDESFDKVFFDLRHEMPMYEEIGLWSGIAFGSKMNDLDVIYITVNRQTGNIDLIDGSVQWYGAPYRDTADNVHALSWAYIDNTLRATFARAVNNTDWQDKNLAGCPIMAFPTSGGTLDGTGELLQHRQTPVRRAVCDIMENCRRRHVQPRAHNTLAPPPSETAPTTTPITGPTRRPHIIFSTWPPRLPNESPSDRIPDPPTESNRIQESLDQRNQFESELSKFWAVKLPNSREQRDQHIQASSAGPRQLNERDFFQTRKLPPIAGVNIDDLHSNQSPLFGSGSPIGHALPTVVLMPNDDTQERGRVLLVATEKQHNLLSQNIIHGTQTNNNQNNNNNNNIGQFGQTSDNIYEEYDNDASPEIVIPEPRQQEQQIELKFPRDNQPIDTNNQGDVNTATSIVWQQRNAPDQGVRNAVVVHNGVNQCETRDPDWCASYVDELITWWHNFQQHRIGMCQLLIPVRELCCDALWQRRCV